MKRLRLNTWCWYNYLKPSKKDFRFKLKIPIVFLLSIFLYKLILNGMNISFLLISIMLILFLVYYPKLLIITIILIVIFFLSKLLLNVEYIDRYIDGNYTVVSKLKMGPIIKVEGHRILVRSTENVNPGDVISLNGHVIRIKNTSTFDMVAYLKTKQVASQIYPKNLSIIAIDRSFFTIAHTYIKTGSDI